MKKSQIIIVVIAIIAVIFLFNLPKHLVKDNRDSKSGGQMSMASPKEGEKSDAHSAELNPKDLLAINNLRKAFLTVSDKEKKINFADSLANMFKNLNKFDSCAKYKGEIAAIDGNVKNLTKAGDAYFEASTFSIDPNKGQDLAVKARAFFEKAQKMSPEDLSLQTKLANTYLGTQDPANTMSAVRMLKEVIEKDPTNRDALLTLGKLSLQSGQNDKAVERFVVMTKAHPEDPEAQFYLAYSYMMTGEKQKARENFEKLKKMTKDPSILDAANQYLKEIK